MEVTARNSSASLLKSQNPVSSQRNKATLPQVKQKYSSTRKCVSSPAGLLVLLWLFLVSFLFLILHYEKVIVPHNLRNYNSILLSCVSAILFLAYPIAGHLADTKFGRYRVLVASLWTLVPAAVFEITAISVIGFLTRDGAVEVSTHELHTVASALGITAGAISIVLLIIGTSGFYANAIQFGLDQLHDSPAEDQSLFIHWYMWAYYSSKLIMTVALSGTKQSGPTNILGHVVILLVLTCTAVTLFTSMCYTWRNKHWFLIQPSQQNPYKLVYLITKFSFKHKMPLNRSAFTYCEDDIPTGLNLGKDKYGGPFTTEQVEDVKAFYGILQVLLALGPMFFLDSARDMLKPVNSNVTHTVDKCFLQAPGDAQDYAAFLKELLINDSVLYYLASFVSLPLYIFAIRPLVLYRIPKMLKRIGIGLMVIFISTILTGIIGNLHSLAHCPHTNTRNSTESHHHDIHLEYLLALPEVLAAISHMLVYVALYEFICSQSPSSMKGVLIGLTYSIRGLYELLAFGLHFIQNVHTKSKVEYSLVIVVVGIVFLLVYRRVARKYKYRVRDELCNIQQFVEEYYSKTEAA